MREPVTAYVGLGSNLGDSAATLQLALQQLDQLPGTTLTRCSSQYRSAPVDACGPDYCNAVAELATRLSAPELLGELQRLEGLAGRARPYRNAPRTLDLDLLLYGDARIDSATLVLPHPRMWQRAFVVLPLAELAPALVPAQTLQALSAQRIARL